MTIETECKEDGRWIAEVPELPGGHSYGETEAEACVKVPALAREVIADCRRQRIGAADSDQ